MKTKNRTNILLTVLATVAVLTILILEFWPNEKIEVPQTIESSLNEDFDFFYKPFEQDIFLLLSNPQVLYELTNGKESGFKILEVKEGAQIKINYLGQVHFSVVPYDGWFFQTSRGIHGKDIAFLDVEVDAKIINDYTFRKFPLLWSVEDLGPVIKKFPLTCRDNADGLPIENYEAFLQLKESCAGFKEVLFEKETAPAWIIEDKKGEVILLNQREQFWLTREKSHKKNGWPYYENSVSFPGL